MGDDDPPPKNTNASCPQEQSQTQAQQPQLHLETGLVSLPTPQDRNQLPASQNPSQIDLFDDCDQEPREPLLKRKKISESPPSSPLDSPTPKTVENHTNDQDMSEEDDSDSEDEDGEISENITDEKKNTKSGKKPRKTQQRRKTGQQNLARVPRRAEFPVVVRDLRGGSATLQGLGPSRREQALSNHIGNFQWIMGFRREGQFMVACRDKNQQTKLANTTSLSLGPGMKMYVECNIPSPHTEGVIKGIPLGDEISKEDIKVLINGKETSGLATNVQRLKRRDGQLSKALRIKFAKETLPEEVIVFKSLYRVSAYVANPIRCTRCNIFGHHWKTCQEKEQICPRCGSSGHDARNCKGLKYCINCQEEGHSAAYIGCPYYKKLKKANQIRASTWMPLHEALKRAGESCLKPENHKEAYLGAELSLNANAHTPREQDKIWPPPRINTQTLKNNKNKPTPKNASEDQTRNGDEFPILVTQSNTEQKKENHLSTPSKDTTNKKTTGSNKNESNKDKNVTKVNPSPNENAMNEILKRLDKIVERQEKQEKETEHLKACQENQTKETASLRESFEEEKAKRLELEKKFTKENVKALQQQQNDSRKTTALKEIFTFFLTNMNSGNSGSAAAGQLDAILSKYIIDDGHHAFIGNQIKAAGEFICKKDSLTEEHLYSLTNYINNKQ